MKLLVPVVVALVLLVAVGASASDPTLNVPVVSPFVCSLKGDTWTDGDVALGLATGCYEAPPAEVRAAPTAVPSVAPLPPDPSPNAGNGVLIIRHRECLHAGGIWNRWHCYTPDGLGGYLVDGVTPTGIWIGRACIATGGVWQEGACFADH